MRRPALAFHLQHHRRQGQKAMGAVEMAGAHRELGGLNRVANRDRLALGWHFRRPVLRTGAQHAPLGRCQPLQQQRPAALAHLQPLQMAHVVANQIGAGSPGRQAQQERPLARRQADPHLHQLTAGGGKIELDLRHRIRSGRGGGPHRAGRRGRHSRG